MASNLSELEKITFCSEYCYLFFEEQTGIKLPSFDFEKDIRGCMINIDTLRKCNIESSGSTYLYEFVREDKELYSAYCEFVKRKLNEKYPVGTFFAGNTLWQYPRTEKVGTDIFVYEETGTFYYRESEASHIIPLLSVDYSGRMQFYASVDTSGRLYSSVSRIAIDLTGYNNLPTGHELVTKAFFENPVISFVDADSHELPRLNSANKIMCIIDNTITSNSGFPIIFDVITYEDAKARCGIVY
jgi:hypothetical protein